MPLVIAGSVSTSATSPGASASASESGSLNCAMRTRPVTPFDRPRCSGCWRPLVAVDEPLLEVPVVVPLEQHHDLAIGDGASQPDRLGVRLRRRERELPVGLERIAPRELLGDRDRVLGRQQELGREPHALADGLHDLGHRVAAEHREVARVEVDVGETVDIGEPRALAVIDVDRCVVVRGHPRHRRAVRHVRARSSEKRVGARTIDAEPLELFLVESSDQVPIEVALGRHRSSLPVAPLHQPAQDAFAPARIGVEHLPHLAEARLLVGALCPAVVDLGGERDPRGVSFAVRGRCRPRPPRASRDRGRSGRAPRCGCRDRTCRRPAGRRSRAPRACTEASDRTGDSPPVGRPARRCRRWSAPRRGHRGRTRRPPRQGSAPGRPDPTTRARAARPASVQAVGSPRRRHASGGSSGRRRGSDPWREACQRPPLRSSHDDRNRGADRGSS